MTMHEMDCAALDERLADYLEDELDDADRRRIETHVTSCVRCTALVRDLEDIRAGAAELPELVPSTDLWGGIARRIDTPVVPFAVRPAPNVVVARRNFDTLKRAAIAAALVAVTAGVTYTLTVARNPAGPAASTVTAAKPSPAGADTSGPFMSGPGSRDTRVASTDSAPPTGDPTEAATTLGRPERTQVINEAGAATYSREIDRLRSIFARHRSQLDPRTAAIIEANLKVIDDAIAQSKAALAQDPASQFLNEQLKSARDKKLELLRTAALLPSRT